MIMMTAQYEKLSEKIRENDTGNIKKIVKSYMDVKFEKTHNLPRKRQEQKQVTKSNV